MIMGSSIDKANKRLMLMGVSSRLPLQFSYQEIPIPGKTILLMEHLNTMPISAKQVRFWTQWDPILSKVLHFVL